MALHYLLLFPYGEDGWHPNIPLNGVIADADLDEDHAEKAKLQRKHCNETMAEFYGYRLQHQDTDSIALLRGDQLRHQYIVDAYAVIEQNRLNYLRLNQKNFVRIFIKAFRMPSLQVTITLLPLDRNHSTIFFHRRSTSHGPELSRCHGNMQMGLLPDAFVTFTCNPQWLEIKRAFLLRQQPQDRPDLVTRMFKIQLKELINDIHKKHILVTLKVIK
jgi:hypothetical protein